MTFWFILKTKEKESQKSEALEGKIILVQFQSSFSWWLAFPKLEGSSNQISHSSLLWFGVGAKGGKAKVLVVIFLPHLIQSRVASSTRLRQGQQCASSSQTDTSGGRLSLSQPRAPAVHYEKDIHISGILVKGLKDG